jgi:hypothetical protein
VRVQIEGGAAPTTTACEQRLRRDEIDGHEFIGI